MLIRTNIYLTQEIVRYLDQRAKEEKTTKSAILREAIRDKLDQEETNWAASLLELAKQAGKSGIGDLSQKHDDYLYGKGRKWAGYLLTAIFL